MRHFLLVCLGIISTIDLYAQKSKINVIDVHIHAPLEPGNVTGENLVKYRSETISNMDSLNIVFGVLNGLPEFFDSWNSAAPDRFMNFILFPCVDGKAPNGGRDCFANGKSFPDIKWLRKQIESGKIKGLGEITAEYIGMSPNDPALEPYWPLPKNLIYPSVSTWVLARLMQLIHQVL